MPLIEELMLDCPYCGETLEISVDCTAGDQRYIEDCQVCCAPIEFSVRIDNHGNVSELQVRRDNE